MASRVESELALLHLAAQQAAAVGQVGHPLQRRQQDHLVQHGLRPFERVVFGVLQPVLLLVLVLGRRVFLLLGVSAVGEACAAELVALEEVFDRHPAVDGGPALGEAGEAALARAVEDAFDLEGGGAPDDLLCVLLLEEVGGQGHGLDEVLGLLLLAHGGPPLHFFHERLQLVPHHAFDFLGSPVNVHQLSQRPVRLVLRRVPAPHCPLARPHPRLLRRLRLRHEDPALAAVDHRPRRQLPQRAPHSRLLRLARLQV